MISHVYMAKRAEGPRGPSHPPGTAVSPASGTPPGGSGKVGEAASEKVPGSEKGPDRTTASGRACGRNGCPAGRAEGGAPQASGEGEATRTVGDRHCFLHWLRLGPRFLPSQSPASFPVEAALGPPLNSPLCCVHWCQQAPRAWGLWRPIQASRGQPASRGVWGAPQSSAPRAESCRPSSCTISKHVDRRKGEWAEATASCPLGWRLTRPLGAGDHTAVQTGGSRVALGSWRRWGLRAASWARLRAGSAQQPWGRGWGRQVEAGGAQRCGGCGESPWRWTILRGQRARVSGRPAGSGLPQPPSMSAAGHMAGPATPASRGVPATVPYPRPH